MRINVELKISINSGAALLIFVTSFFAMLWMLQHHESVERVFPVALTGLTAAFSGYLYKRNSDNKLSLESEKLKFTNEANGAAK